MSSKQFISINNKYDRVVVLVDMDCFYCQVEEKLNPDILGKPIAVVQYNPWQGGGIIAVNYPARAKGVTRHMRGDEAKQHCPDIVLPQVPQVRGKADISKYRDAGKEVAAVLQTFTPLLERASIDEAYLDITERVLARLRDMNEGKFHLLPDKLANTFAVGYDSIGEFVQKISGDLESKTNSQEMDSADDKVAFKKSDIKLLIGASIVNEIRAAVKEKTGFECSAGISHNKILAKLTAGFHKPNKQTILPLKCIPKMYETLPLKKVKGLGGKLGDQVCDVLKIQTMSELAKFPEKLLQNHFDERLGSWMYLMAKGIDLEAVTPKFNAKSIGCCKRFPGKNAISGISTLKHWLSELANEIQERLEKDMEENNRIAKQMTVSYAQQFGQNDVSSTRSVPLIGYDSERIAADALEAIKRNTDVFLKSDSAGALNNPIKFLGISAGKFEENFFEKKNSLKEMFSIIAKKVKDSDLKTEDELASGNKKPENNDLIFSEAQTAPNDLDVSKKDTQNNCNKQPNESDKKETATSMKMNGLKKISKSNKGYETSKAWHYQSSVIKVEVSDAIDEKHRLILVEEHISNGTETIHVRNNAMNIPASDSESYVTNSEIKKDIVDPHSKDAQFFTKTQEVKEINQCNSPHDKNNAAKFLGETKSGQTESSTMPLKMEQKLSPSSAVSIIDYRQTYAEFNRPLNLSEPMKKSCPECDNDVPVSEFQSHLDFHFALSLSQHQREEFRAQLKSKHLSPASSTSKSKHLQPVPKKPSSINVPSIDKYLAMATVNNSSEEGAVVTCTDCGKKIPTTSMQEHLDYHVARKIQIELNKQEMQKIKSNELNVDASNGSNLKRKRPPTSEKSQTNKSKNLSLYFTKM